MVNKIGPIDPKVITDPLIERQIKVLEQNGDPKTVLNENELIEYGEKGHAGYLAYLYKLRQSLAENENW